VACSASIEIAVYVAVSAAAGVMAVFLLWRYESPTHKASSFPDISEESQGGFSGKTPSCEEHCKGLGKMDARLRT